MAKFIIVRSNEWMNRARRIGIYVDGQKLGTISNGSTQEFDILSGMHTFKAKVDWCGSRDYSFFISEDETKTIKLSSFGYQYHFISITTGILALHFLLHFVFGIDYLVWVFAFFMPIILYYITIGRNDYLVISETL